MIRVNESIKKTSNWKAIFRLCKVLWERMGVKWKIGMYWHWLYCLMLVRIYMCVSRKHSKLMSKFNENEIERKRKKPSWDSIGMPMYKVEWFEQGKCFSSPSKSTFYHHTVTAWYCHEVYTWGILSECVRYRVDSFPALNPISHSLSFLL